MEPKSKWRSAGQADRKTKKAQYTLPDDVIERIEALKHEWQLPSLSAVIVRLVRDSER